TPGCARYGLLMTDIAEITGPNKIGLLSLGAYRPERVVTNEEICEHIESSDEWIYTRTGIKSRRFAADDESAQTLAIEAGRKAIANALLTGAEIDAVIVGTSTHYLQTPASAPAVATALGAQGVPAFDLSAGCAGFGYAVGVAGDMIRGGSASKVLVIGSEKLSPALDMTDRGNCFIFGDGAGAVVVGETAEQGIGPTVWGSDGSQSNAIRTSVFRWAAFEMGKVGQRAMEAAKVGPEQIDVFVPHQANTRINELLAKNLHLRPDAVIANDIEHTGNTSAASVPLAMETLLSTGAAKPGDLALLI
ncbi:3-oxoacyl-[acyl-carrier-protein] synthase 3, partial [Aduncisulcus paluster]